MCFELLPQWSSLKEVVEQSNPSLAGVVDGVFMEPFSECGQSLHDLVVGEVVADAAEMQQSVVYVESGYSLVFGVSYRQLLLREAGVGVFHW